MLPQKKRPLDQVRDRMRLKNYAYRTEKSYLYWIKLLPNQIFLDEVLRNGVDEVNYIGKPHPLLRLFGNTSIPIKNK